MLDRQKQVKETLRMQKSISVPDYIQGHKILINDSHHEALIELRIFVDGDNGELIDDQFSVILKHIIFVGQLDQAELVEKLAINEGVLDGWLQSRDAHPTGGHSQAVLRQAVELAAVGLEPCSPKYRYPGQVILDGWVFPLGMLADTALGEIVSKYPPRSLKTSEALKELGILTVGTFLENPQAIMEVKGVGNGSVNDVYWALRKAGVRAIGTKLLNK